MLFFFFLLSLLTMLWLSLLWLLILLLVVLLVLLLVLLSGNLIDPSLKSSSYMISNLVSSSQSHKETAVWGLSLVSFYNVHFCFTEIQHNRLVFKFESMDLELAFNYTSRVPNQKRGVAPSHEM